MAASARRSGDIIIIKNAFHLKNELRKLGGSWNMNYKSWKIPFSKQNIKFLTDNNIQLCSLLQQEIANKNKEINIDGITFKTSPYKHQIELVKLFLEKKKVMFLCGVGTGKSKASIDCIVNCQVKKTLIVAPACTLYNFHNEIKKHSHLDSIVLCGPLKERKEKLQIKGIDVFIINYDILIKLEKELINMNFDLIVFDEIHYLKNHQSKRARCAYNISKNIPHRIGLTGTLISNNIQDAFGPYKVIDESLFGKVYAAFKNKFLIMGGYTTRFGPTQVVGYKNEDLFKRILAQNSLKYEIDDVKDLPPTIEEVKEFAFSKKTKGIYEDMKLGFHEKVDINSVLAQILNLQKICSGFIADEYIGKEKIDALKNIIEEIGNQKILIWCRFTNSIDRLRKELESEGKKIFVYDGRTNEKDYYRKFEQHEGPAILVSQLQMGIGWEVPSCKYSIFYELDYSLTHLVQAKGRTRRLKGSETNKCVYIYLLASNSIETAIYSVLQSKDFQAKDALQYVEGGK